MEGRHRGEAYELIQIEGGRKKIFEDREVDALVSVFKELYPFKIIKKIQNVIGQLGNVLEK